ncbi:hypothetical protein, partial [Daejeonella sp.]|uniref:hypothetical protein n=1 Tax=Daejeonella sp. TaxID=2805397 RepID=UPI0030BE066F
SQIYLQFVFAVKHRQALIPFKERFLFKFPKIRTPLRTPLTFIVKLQTGSSAGTVVVSVGSSE